MLNKKPKIQLIYKYNVCKTAIEWILSYVDLNRSYHVHQVPPHPKFQLRRVPFQVYFHCYPLQLFGHLNLK